MKRTLVALLFTVALASAGTAASHVVPTKPVHAKTVRQLKALLKSERAAFAHYSGVVKFLDARLGQGWAGVETCYGFKNDYARTSTGFVYCWHKAKTRQTRNAIRRTKAKLDRLATVLDWRTVGATSYGPSIDPGMGTTGACYSLSAHPWSYAEMQGGSGLGGLPCGYRLVVKNPANGRVAVLEKGDTGCGLPPGCYGSVGNSGPDRIDLWEHAHYSLGFSGYGPLLIAPAPKGWALGPVRG